MARRFVGVACPAVVLVVACALSAVTSVCTLGKRSMFRRRLLALVAGIVIILTMASGAWAAVEILDAYYRPDRTLPEYQIFWKDSYKWGDVPNSYLASGALAIYVRSTGSGSFTISDLTINGASLSGGMKCSTELFYCSQVACSTVNNATLSAAGQPVWYRIDPATVAPGGTAQIFVRMRSRVLTTLSIGVVTSAGTQSTSVTVTNNMPPRVAGYAMSSDMTKLYLYLRHPVAGMLPSQILIDGVDKTAACTIAADAGCDIAPIRCNLGTTYSQGSFHCFQAVYGDGSQATEGLRVYYDVFRHGRWGSPPATSDAEKRDVLLQMGYHSQNFQKGSFGDASDYTNTADGKAILNQYGIKQIWEDPTYSNTYSIFLCDEPDAHEDLQSAAIQKYCPAIIGALSQSLADEAQSFKTGYPQYPTMLNLDASFKPYNYYIYGHSQDILSVDPYYQTRLVDAYWDKPNTKDLYSKATYVYAVSSTCEAACEPRRLHVIINSCRKEESGVRVFRWATPEEKRIEFYYALAAGAKEIDYWWFTRNAQNFNGIGAADEPGSAALWREIGLLGAEAGLAGPLIVNSTPAVLPISKPGALWTRTLVSGTDTLILLCVNDDYSSNDAGSVVRPISSAEVSLNLPAWLGSPAAVFEIDYKGVRDVSYGVTSGKIYLHLGQVGVTRMIVITTDSTLKSALQSSYSNTYAPRVAQLIPLP